MTIESIREYILTTRQGDPADQVAGAIYSINRLRDRDGTEWVELGIPTQPVQHPDGSHAFDWYRVRVSDPDRARMIESAYSVGDRVRAVGREWHRVKVQFGWVVFLESTDVGPDPADPQGCSDPQTAGRPSEKFETGFGTYHGPEDNPYLSIESFEDDHGGVTWS